MLNENYENSDSLPAEFPEKNPVKPGAAKKLTPERKEKILSLLREGNYIETTAKACGLCSMSIHRWIKFGREIAKSNRDPKTLTKAEKWFLSFYKDVEQARAEAETMFVGIIKNAAEKNWVAAMTLLERRHPDRWGKKDRIEHSGGTNNNVDVNITGLSLEEMRSLAKLSPEETDSEPEQESFEPESESGSDPE